MSREPIRLYRLEDIQQFIKVNKGRFGADRATDFAEQLLETMHINERLQEALSAAGNILSQNNINTDFIAEVLWNKHPNHSEDMLDMVKPNQTRGENE